MKKTSLIALALCFALSTPSIASPLGGNVEEFATTFNRQAKKLKLQTRFSKSSCQDIGQKVLCMYIHSSALGIIAHSEIHTKSINELLIVYGGKKSKGFEALEAIATLLMLYAPNSSSDERGVFFDQMLDLVKDREDGKAYIHNVTFSFKFTDTMPMMITVGKNDD